MLETKLNTPVRRSITHQILHKLVQVPPGTLYYYRILLSKKNTSPLVGLALVKEALELLLYLQLDQAQPEDLDIGYFHIT